eukprot:9912387-Alexandrium_andersonii.AAC.1
MGVVVCSFRPRAQLKVSCTAPSSRTVTVLIHLAHSRRRDLEEGVASVSYTHLTLPTICSV